MYDAKKDSDEMMRRIKAICRERGITNNALAKEAGISNSTISYLLNAKSTPYLYTVLMICHSLNITLADLLDPSIHAKSFSEEHTFSKEEKELLRIYRALPPDKKEYLLTSIRMLEQYVK